MKLLSRTLENKNDMKEIIKKSKLERDEMIARSRLRIDQLVDEIKQVWNKEII